ncbi:MAG: SPOR domain-containing protein [Nonlabens sp.]
MKKVLVSFFILIGGFVIAQDGEQVDPKVLDQLIKEKAVLDKKGTFKERYTIQLFYGDRAAAKDIESKYKRLDYTWNAEMFWEAPYLAVRVGSFKNRIEAERALLKLKDFFKQAKVMKP